MGILHSCAKPAISQDIIYHKQYVTIKMESRLFHADHYRNTCIHYMQVYKIIKNGQVMLGIRIIRSKKDVQKKWNATLVNFINPG